MFIGGMFIQILIQAAILRLSLKLIAKHEADTSYPKAIMVTAGISIGQFIVAILAASLHPLAVLPAIIAFTAAVIMFFCWISFWKSLIVVFVYMAIQGILLFIMALIMGGAVILSMLGIGGSSSKPMSPPPQYEQAAAAQREAMRMQQKAMQKQAQIEAEVRRMEQGADYPPPPPQPTPQPAPSPTPKPPPKPAPKPAPKETPTPVSPDIDWNAARQQVRVGGTMAGGRSFLALVNGKMVDKGDIVKAEYNGREYRWTVRTITSKEVKLEQLDVL
jgi:hypothetical protein